MGPAHPDVGAALNSLANIHQATSEYAEATVLYGRALTIQEKALGPEHPLVARSLGDLGGLALEEDRPATALPLLERAVAIYDAHEGMQPGEPEVHFSLAKVLVRTSGDHTRVLALARKAADGFRAAGEGMAKHLAEVEAFLAMHDDPVSEGRPI